MLTIEDAVGCKCKGTHITQIEAGKQYLVLVDPMYVNPDELKRVCESKDGFGIDANLVFFFVYSPHEADLSKVLKLVPLEQIREELENASKK